MYKDSPDASHSLKLCWNVTRLLSKGSQIFVSCPSTFAKLYYAKSLLLLSDVPVGMS
ncbi:hypothetical protein H8959_003930 [Pygathrix nigripes]